MADINKPTTFGTKIAQSLLGPQGSAQYLQQPQQVNNVINAVSQQIADQTTDPQIDCRGQFIKNYVWTALKPQQQQPAIKMNAVKSINPMEAPNVQK